MKLPALFLKQNKKLKSIRQPKQSIENVRLVITDCSFLKLPKPVESSVYTQLRVRETRECANITQHFSKKQSLRQQLTNLPVPIRHKKRLLNLNLNQCNNQTTHEYANAYGYETLRGYSRDTDDQDNSLVDYVYRQ